MAWVAAGLVGSAATAAAQGNATVDTAAAARSRLWVRPVASLVVPGSGQLMAGQDRGLAYLGIEAYLIVTIIHTNQIATSERDRYRQLAFDVARRSFSPAQQDTAWEYYETMEKYLTSGAFNLSSGPALVPETNPTTYNGSVWLLARETYWADPNTPPPPTSLEYQEALAFYRAHAVGPGYLWSWTNASAQLGEYRTAIKQSDDAYRTVQGQVGLLLANHLVSAVDALISSQLSTRLRRPAEIRTAILGWHRAGVAVTLGF